MVQLDTDDFDYLFDVNAPDSPQSRTWLELLKDTEEWEKLSQKRRLEVLEMYGLDAESDLSEVVSEEQINEFYGWETPQGSACAALSDLNGNPAAANVLEFQEAPSIGSAFEGVRLVGTRAELRSLLKSTGLDTSVSVQRYVETVLPKAKTQYVKDRLFEMIETDQDDVETADQLLALEKYIEAGEPEIKGFILGSAYGSVTDSFPQDSPEYTAVKEDLRKR